MRLFWTLLTIGLTCGFSFENIKQSEVETLTGTVHFDSLALEQQYVDGIDAVPADDPWGTKDISRLTLAQEDSGAEPEALGDLAPESEPILVEVGVRIQQITGIDQRSENFGMVGDLKMQFQDPKLRFDPESCDCTSKIMHAHELIDLAKASRTTWPEFLLFNRQGLLRRAIGRDSSGWQCELLRTFFHDAPGAGF